MMKCLIFTYFLLASVYAINKEVVQNFLVEMKKIADECSVETNAGPDAVAEIFQHKVPSTKEGKCLVFCIHKYYRIQKDDGSIDREGAMQLLNNFKALDPDLHDKVLAVFLKCDAQIKIDADPCITASNIAECALNEMKAAGISEDFVLE